MVETLSRAKILIVDDEPSNVQLLESVLRREGLSDLHTTTDSRAALELVKSLSPDILLLDLHMPHVDGLAILASLAVVSEARNMQVLVLTADTSVETKRTTLTLGAKDFLAKPFDHIEAVLRIKNLLETRRLQMQLEDQNRTLEMRVQERTAELWDSIRQLQKAENELRLSQEETVRRLSIAAEFRDDETARHIRRMSRYCGFLAERIGLDDITAKTILVASEMHDVGKIGVPDSILLKPGPLTPAERSTMQKHTGYGWSILEGSESDLLRFAATIALTHHERLDGAGYPRQLEGEAIPLMGRIAAIADVFDALSTDRVYRGAFPLPEVWRMMRAERGAHFDPDILDIFFDSMNEVLSIMEDNPDVSRRQ